MYNNELYNCKTITIIVWKQFYLKVNKCKHRKKVVIIYSEISLIFAIIIFVNCHFFNCLQKRVKIGKGKGKEYIFKKHTFISI